MRNTFQRRALLVLGGPLFSKGWKEMVGGGSEFLRRWSSTQQTLTSAPGSQSTLNWVVGSAHSKEQLVNLSKLSQHPPFWGCELYPQKSQQEMSISFLNVSQCTLSLQPVPNSFLGWDLCPLIMSLISCWASNQHVDPEYNCEVRDEWGEGIKMKKKEERRVAICNVWHTIDSHLPNPVAGTEVRRVAIGHKKLEMPRASGSQWLSSESPSTSLRDLEGQLLPFGSQWVTCKRNSLFHSYICMFQTNLLEN